ncbi:MAG: hypothetical protein QE263_02500 [Vampirovibrionales bacterium]|nr:hypothetical protein [Vampirovibrionales bacterium]
MNCQTIQKIATTVKNRIIGAPRVDGFTQTCKAMDHFQIRLPGFKHDPEWAKAMQQAVDDSVAILNGDRKLAVKIITNAENVALCKKMFDKGQNPTSALQKLVEGSPSAKALCDQVIGNAHLKYMKTTPKYASVSAEGVVGRNVCCHGISRELAYGGRTEFALEKGSEPYAVYAKRARAHLVSPHNKEGRMVAQLSRLERNAAGQLVYKNPDAAEILLNKTTENYWEPMDEEQLKVVWAHIDDIFQDLVKLKKPHQSDAKALKDIMDKTAEMKWWFFQAMPDARGSAAVGDVLSKVIYKKLGIVVPPYKMGVGPDLEAYVEPLHTFVDNYPNLFDGKIQLLK